MLLLDTSVVSAVRRPERHPEVARWLAAQSSEALFLSAVTIGEIQRGIVQEERVDAAFARELSVWLSDLMASFGDRVLAFDFIAAHRWGRLSAELGHDTPDLMVAATALEHRLIVVTRNVEGFEAAGVETFDPFG